MPYATMNKKPLKQANFRLPPDLLDDLRKLSKITNEYPSEIARKGISARVAYLKTRHGLNVATS